MSDTKSPLWKQLIGAAIGAVVALGLYQGYTFTVDHLQALVTLPVGSGIMERRVQPPAYVVPTGTLDFPAQNVLDSRAAEQAASSAASAAAASSSSSSWGTFGPWPYGWVRRFRLFASSSQSSSNPAIAATSSESSVPAPIIVHDTRHTWPTATLGFPTERYIQSSPVAVPPRRIRSFPPTVAIESNASSTASSVSSEIPAMESSASSSSAPSIPVIAPQESSSSSVAVPVAQSASSASAIQWPATFQKKSSRSPQRTPSMTASVQGSKGKSGTLPQSGFGLDVVLVGTIGAVIGRKKAKRA